MHARAAMGVLVLGFMGSGCPPQPVFEGAESGPDRPRPVVLNDDGGWCWFQDERALVQGQRLIFGSVAAGRYDRARRGAIEVTGVDLATGTTTRVRVNEAPLPPEGGYDDHNAPALVVRGDDRLLVVYSGHGTEDCFRHRVSRRSGDPTTWGEERSYSPSPSSRITYSNLHRLPGQENRILNFYRGLDDRSKPSRGRTTRAKPGRAAAS
jgi:hypothetical protein